MSVEIVPGSYRSTFSQANHLVERICVFPNYSRLVWNDRNVMRSAVDLVPGYSPKSQHHLTWAETRENQVIQVEGRGRDSGHKSPDIYSVSHHTGIRPY